MAGRQIRRGAEAERIVLGGLAAGELGLETDTRQVFIGSSVGDIRIHGDYITPEMYGAVGGGVVDDTAALLAAIAACPDGGTIVGTNDYLFSSTITISKRITFQLNRAIHSTAPARRLIKAATLNGDGLNITGAYSSLVGVIVDGVTGNGGDGIVIRAMGVKLEDVAAFRQGGCGIRVGDDSAGTPTCNANCFYLARISCVGNGSHGLYIHSNTGGAPDANAGVVINPLCDLNGGDGIRVGNAFHNTILGAVTEVNTGWGVNFLAAATNNILLGGDQWEGNIAGQVNDDGSGNHFIGMVNAIAGAGTCRTALPFQGNTHAKMNTLHLNNDGAITWLSIGAERSSNRVRVGFNQMTGTGGIVCHDATPVISPIEIDANPIRLNVNCNADIVPYGNMMMQAAYGYCHSGVKVVGAQAAAQSDLKADYTTLDLDTEAEIIVAINATNAAFNTLLAKQRTHGLIAT